MAVMMHMQWNGIGAAEYDAVRKVVDWEGNPPPGGLFHVMAVGDDGISITDVWETAEQFQAFAQDRLLPGVQQLGIGGEQRVEVRPAHAVFTPGYLRK
jgi:hypothetical protein